MIYILTPAASPMDTHRRWVLELEEGFGAQNCEVGLGP